MVLSEYKDWVDTASIIYILQELQTYKATLHYLQELVASKQGATKAISFTDYERKIENELYTESFQWINGSNMREKLQLM